MTDYILEVKDLHVEFSVTQNKKWPWSKPQILRAVNGVTFALEKGKTLGVVGESGCGKSTLIRAVASLNPIASGEVFLDGQKVDYSKSSDRARVRNNIQMIFQDPVASLNPRMTVLEIVQEPLGMFFPELKSNEREARVFATLDKVGIARRNANRYPHEFSGGQCQRIGIARSLISEPNILLCDEPVSALDVSIQAQVVNLLKELQQELGLAMIFVAHDLGVVRHISNDILVMYLGGMMEHAEAGAMVETPLHPYTQALLSAVPVPDPNVKLDPHFLDGDLPSPLDLPKGCLFSTRCPRAQEECKRTRPELKFTDGRAVNCLFPDG